MNPNLMLRNPTFCHGGRLRITHVENPFQFKTVSVSYKLIVSLISMILLSK